VLLDTDLLDQSDMLIERWWLLSPQSIATAVALTLGGLLLAFSRWGREVYAVGGARTESRAAGVPQRRPIILAFGMSAALAGLAGAVASVIGGSGSSQSFSAVLLLAVTAVLVGGVSAYGGSGSMVNIVLGVLIMQTLISGLTAIGAPKAVQDMATGLLLVAVVVLAVDWGPLAKRLQSARSHQSAAAESQ
jgi:ribose transport system permease protein